jgi:hypothetical protein
VHLAVGRSRKSGSSCGAHCDTPAAFVTLKGEENRKSLLFPDGCRAARAKMIAAALLAMKSLWPRVIL